MKIPETVKIGYAIYNIEKRKIEGEESLGEYDHDKLRIRIATNLKEQLKASVLLHEVLHGIICHSNLKLPNEEEIVMTITEGLCQVIRDNPELIDEIQKTFEDE